eukprot:gnl/TRDRNA2_/TRDRNA2_134595_c1_seq1.p1 gnl/TRDRNA2_/TRDRNA2_134595_c1~~gnl/TRDRNA2_/TRDRNA2_134595_c1_seq1.p1  ORF type:complete len:210 (+),score=20.75 gnl/TRDRNA2_/TRDRNA2_134595_c1_seq1:78-632(+)
MQPRDLDAATRRGVADSFEEWDADSLNMRVRTLRELLDGSPRVIFFHCLCGCDRTGALFAAYAMRYLNMSLTEAIAENELVAGRHMYYNFQISAQWYCENLRARGLYAWDDCGNCEPFRCFDTGAPWDPMLLADLKLLAFVLAVLLLTAAFRSFMCLSWYQSRNHAGYNELTSQGEILLGARSS